MSTNHAAAVMAYARSTPEFTTAQMRGWTDYSPTHTRDLLTALRERGDIELLSESGKGHPGRWRATASVVAPPEQSLRSRVLAALEPGGRFADIRHLEGAIRRPDDNFGHHELMHIVHSLGKQGLVVFEEKKQGNGAQHELHAIRLRPKSAGAGPVVRTTENGPEPDEPIDDSPQVADRAIRAGKPEDYPLIAALVGRRQAINEAARHLEAAGLIELALEALSKIDDLSPLEKEVLRFFSIERPGSAALTSPPSLASAPGGTAGTST